MNALLDKLVGWAARARAAQVTLDLFGADREKVARVAGQLLDLAQDVERARVTSGWDGDDAVGRAYMGQHRALSPRTCAERVEVMRRRLEEMFLPDGEISTLDVSVYRTRYGGSYEHGDSYADVVWFAWVGDIEWLDDAWAGDDACSAFWSHYRDAPVGRGADPNAALADLVRQAKEAR